MPAIIAATLLGLTLVAPAAAQPQTPGLQQTLQGLLSGNQGQDQVVREAYERGLPTSLSPFIDVDSMGAGNSIHVLRNKASVHAVMKQAGPVLLEPWIMTMESAIGLPRSAGPI